MTVPNILGNITIIGNKKEYDYTGKVKTFVVQRTGIYKLEVWGAQGNWNGSRGGYSIGYKTLTAGQTLYIAVGDQVNGYNGGGKGYWVANSSDTAPIGGGGATHIASVTGTLAEIGEKNLSKIYVVAGGGGGVFSSGIFAGAGGGLSGGNGTYGSGWWGTATSSAKGGTQTAGGTKYGTNSSDGSFGQGGYGNNAQGWASCGGGGGLYGGGGSDSPGAGCGGGSGYIGGVEDYNGNKAQTIGGDSKMPTTDGKGTETGHEGPGYARITFIE